MTRHFPVPRPAGRAARVRACSLRAGRTSDHLVRSRSCRLVISKGWSEIPLLVGPGWGYTCQNLGCFDRGAQTRRRSSRQPLSHRSRYCSAIDSGWTTDQPARLKHKISDTTAITTIASRMWITLPGDDHAPVARVHACGGRSAGWRKPASATTGATDKWTCRRGEA